MGRPTWQGRELKVAPRKQQESEASSHTASEELNPANHLVSERGSTRSLVEPQMRLQPGRQFSHSLIRALNQRQPVKPHPGS